MNDISSGQKYKNIEHFKQITNKADIFDKYLVLNSKNRKLPF